MGLTHFGSKPPVAIVGTAFLIIGFNFQPQMLLFSFNYCHNNTDIHGSSIMMTMVIP